MGIAMFTIGMSVPLCAGPDVGSGFVRLGRGPDRCRSLSEVGKHRHEDIAESEAEFADARQANTNSDRYETAASSFAMVLFFGGISLVIAWRRLRWILLSGASVVLVWAGVYLISLPVA
jgi:hypothetical protein